MLKIMDIAASAMSAQQQRLGTVASNLANVDSASSNATQGYKARRVVFALDQQGNDPTAQGVKVASVVEDQRPMKATYQPGHPLADDKGYVYMPNVNPVEEMTDMMSASRTYQINADVMNAAKQMAQKALALGSE
jgi:flagellar basal-body rod protein FlgC